MPLYSAQCPIYNIRTNILSSALVSFDGHIRNSTLINHCVNVLFIKPGALATGRRVPGFLELLCP